MTRAMKDSGIEWIGEIPEKWTRTKLIHMLRTFITDGPHETPVLVEQGIPFISVDSLNESEDINFDICKKYISEESFAEYSKKTNIEIGDIFFTKAATIGKTAIVNKLGFMVWSPIAVIKVDSNKAHNKYIYHLLNCSKLIDNIKLLGSANTQINVGMKELESAIIPIPPITEQRRIASFLDSKCQEIDNVLAKTRSSIEEYKKLKQAIITKAVTKGIRSNRKMKDSGIEWIGKIPEEWGISRIGLLYNIILGKMLCTEPADESYTLEEYFCAADVHFDNLNYKDLKKMWFSTKEKNIYSVQNGDVLIVEGGAGAGGCNIVKNCDHDIYIQNSIMILRHKQGLSNLFLKFYIENIVKRGYIDVVCNKATIPHFTKEKVANVPIPVIQYEEQQEITDYLDSKCSEIDTLISKKEQLITELEAYKKSLIYEYVTGKKEVPAI